ncbi:MAG TPA: NADH-quinone oxidoreductase subunit N [Candidatus Acidoferrales bacterium]
MPPLEDYLRVAPEIVAALFGVIIMVADPFVARERRAVLARAGVMGAGLALAAVLLPAQYTGEAFSRLIVVDDMSVFLRLLIYGVTLLVILASADYLEREGRQMGEYYALVLFAAVGMGVMASANELITAFVGLEVSSISTYVLAGFRRDAPRSNESAMKYFLLGSFATAFFLYGVAMTYGATGTTWLRDLPAQIRTADPLLITLGFGLMFVGLAFKISTVPFHVWTPDVYEGAPSPVTALLSTAPKAAAMAVALRIFFTAFGEVGSTWMQLIWISAVLTMFVGNLAALAQTNVKRMLAYSSIAHVGYLLVAVAAQSALGVAAVLFYLAAYALMKLGAFTIVAHLGGAGERRVEIEDYAGLGWQHPAVAFCLSVYLMSLMGLPLTAGFLGKVYLLDAALKSDLVWLVVMAVINTLISAYYYLRVVRVMYFSEPRAEWPPVPVPLAVGVVLLLTAAGTLYLGIFPSDVMNWAAQAAASLR